MQLSVNPPFCFPLLMIPSLFVLANPSFYLLGEPASLARGANIDPLLSLVCYQLFSPCGFTHPRHPTDQVTYLHRRHQQHQPSRLIQISSLCIDRGSTQMVEHKMIYSSESKKKPISFHVQLKG